MNLFVGYIVLFLLLNLLFPLSVETEYSTLIVSSDKTLLHAFLTSDEKWRMYTDLEEITPELKKAIVFKEDKFFYLHPGVNPVAVARAIFNNIRSGKRTSGASTITMQVARLLQPKERTYLNKIRELFRAFQLELKFTKDEILQFYLNLVPYGSNIEGVKSASVIYLGKMPDHLSIGEIAALSIIPNRPVSLRPGINNERIVEERNKWLRRYRKAGLFRPKYIEDALTEPLDAYRHEVPRLAPHLAYRLKSQYPQYNIIHTSLDFELQQKTEKIVSEYSRRLYFQNIKNAVVLVVDNRSRKVIAYIGSADFNNTEDGGQVDGMQAIRSPGSTLKPFLYGIAFDKGLVTPKSIITDVPTSFSGYEPENYDEKFNGNITVERALASSLNVPAVKILYEIQPSTFIEKLIDGGCKQIQLEKEHLGLSMVLGGCGVTLEELTGLYCSLANEGKYGRLCFLKSDSSISERQIISEESAFMITEILTQLKRPDLPLQWDNSLHTPKIAWKTGTSYGRRDAWSIGYNNKYTVGVWIGNFSGEGVPELSGAEKATPLLFQVFNAVDYDTDKEWFSMPEKLGLRYVCSQSGKIPNEFCNDLIIDYYIPGVSNMKQCNHMKKVLISPDSSISYCTSCKPELGYRTALYPNLSPEIIAYNEQNHIPYRKIPPHNPDCERLLTGSRPVITSPVHENEYYVNVKDSMEIMLSCNTSNDAERIYWYIDNKFLCSVEANKTTFFRPHEGKVEISCSDDKGRNTDIVIFVTYTSF
jgi:penicillin-binding protein 1C